MRDLTELADSIDGRLSHQNRKIALCKLLLEELKTLEGKDLAPYLSDFIYDMVKHETKIVLRFPDDAPIFEHE